MAAAITQESFAATDAHIRAAVERRVRADGEVRDLVEWLRILQHVRRASFDHERKDDD